MKQEVKEGINVGDEDEIDGLDVSKCIDEVFLSRKRIKELEAEVEQLREALLLVFLDNDDSVKIAHEALEGK